MPEEVIELTEESALDFSRPCRSCSAALEASQIECPNCGSINLPGRRVREERNRPTREEVRVVESRNYNGRYKIYRNSDGSFSCTCLSFLFQRGTSNGSYPFMTCKHIREELGSEQPVLNNPRKPSEWQKVALKRLGVESFSDHLTDAQAYFILRDLLQRQGVEYQEYKRLLIDRSKVSLLPLRSFGVEFEGGLGVSKEEFQRKLEEVGIPSIITGYDHILHNLKWKLGSDSSVSFSNELNPVEIVSPKLYGIDGFKEIETVLKLWTQTLPFQNGERIPGVNRNCGTHVHIDAWGWGKDDMLRLAQVWAKIEMPVVWYLVSPSRRNRNYCKAVDMDYLLSILETDFFEASYGPNPSRYYSLNLQAFSRQKTIEFRIHNGTIEGKKIIPWIIFCLKLTDAVKAGLTHADIQPEFNSVMDAIGMGDGAIPIIRDARNFLYGRFQYWKQHAEENPQRAFPNGRPDPVTPAEFETEIRRRQMVEIRNAYSNRRVRLTQNNEELAPNSVHNLAAMLPSSTIAFDRYEALDEYSYRVPSRTADSSYVVTLNADDTLTCSCRGFRAHRHCYHSINLARHLFTQRRLAELEREGGSDNV